MLYLTFETKHIKFDAVHFDNIGSQNDVRQI